MEKCLEIFFVIRMRFSLIQDNSIKYKPIKYIQINQTPTFLSHNFQTIWKSVDEQLIQVYMKTQTEVN